MCPNEPLGTVHALVDVASGIETHPPFMSTTAHALHLESLQQAELQLEMYSQNSGSSYFVVSDHL